MIAMMVRRESVVFEPEDRIRLDMTRKIKGGGTVHYDVGEVYYDFDSGKMCYKLFTDSGIQVQRPNGPYFLDEDLTSGELRRVGKTVTDYVEKSIGRGKNLFDIEQMVIDAPDMTVEFENKPSLYIDINRDGNPVVVKPEKIYNEDEWYADSCDIWLAGKYDDGKPFSFPIIALSDVGLSTVRSRTQESIKQLQNIDGGEQIASLVERMLDLADMPGDGVADFGMFAPAVTAFIDGRNAKVRPDGISIQDGTPWLQGWLTDDKRFSIPLSDVSTFGRASILAALKKNYDYGLKQAEGEQKVQRPAGPKM